MSPPRMGGDPPNPPTPAQGVNFASSNGGHPQTPHSHTRGECHIFEWGGPPKPPHSCAKGADYALANGNFLYHPRLPRLMSRLHQSLFSPVTQVCNCVSFYMARDPTTMSICSPSKASTIREAQVKKIF